MLKSDSAILTRLAAKTTYTPPASLRTTNIGYVYLVYSKRTGLYKIGRTQRPVSQRLKELRQLYPGITLQHAILTDDCIQVELELHHHFREYWVKGEWYNLKSYDVMLFCGVKRITARYA
jgi:hypothetical protein